MKRLLAILLTLTALVTGCSSAKQDPPAPAPAAAAKATGWTDITAGDLLKRLQAGEKPLIIDVREPNEFEAGHVEGAKLMPLGTVEKAIVAAGIKKDQEVVLICRSGNRSAQAAQKLTALGYTNLKNVTGGMIAWEKIGPVTK